MSTHVLRLTVRIHVGAFHREVDLSIPAGSTLADALPEVLELCGAPQITRPWRATTAAGLPLDEAMPLHQSPLDHGDILVLAPAEPVDAPIVRDSAEALVTEFGGSRGAAGGAQLASATGTVGLVAVAALFVPPAAALAAGAIAAFLVVVWRRDAQLLALTAVACAGLAAAVYVEPASRSELGWAVLAGVATAWVVAAVGAALGVVRSRAGASLAAAGMLAALGSVASLLPWLPATTAGAAAVVLGTLVVLALGPGLATKAAGLKVPVLPTAGQDLQISDAHQPDVQQRAARAGRLADGMALGTVLVAAPAVVVIGFSGGAWPQALCAVLAGAVLMHAARHRGPVPAWALTVLGLAACAGVILATVRGEGHTASLIVAALVSVVAAAACLWAPKVRELEPTTMAWWERGEFAAVLVCLPVAVHLTGLFGMIRGLG